MIPRKFRITSVRGIDDLIVEIPEKGALIMLKGDNMRGKSTSLSLIRSMLSGNNKPPTGDGGIIGYFMGADGEYYEVNLDARDNISGSRYFLTHKDKIKQVSPKDVVSLFKYNPMSVEEFISLGLTAEGRRKQRDFVVKAMGDDVYKSYMDVLDSEKKVYQERYDAGVVLKNTPKVEESVEELDAQIAITLKAYQEKLEELNTIKALGEQIRAKLDAKKTWVEKDATYKEKEAELASVREKKQALLNGKLPIDNVEVDDDGIYVIDPEGRRLMLDDSNVATSLGVRTVAKIIAEANKETPIVLVNRLESLNTEMRRSLSEFCREHNVWIIAEDVDETKDKVVAEIFEEK